MSIKLILRTQDKKREKTVISNQTQSDFLPSLKNQIFGSGLHME